MSDAYQPLAGIRVVEMSHMIMGKHHAVKMLMKNGTTHQMKNTKMMIT